MTFEEQKELFAREFGEEEWNTRVVPMRSGSSWRIMGTIPADPQAAFPDDLTVVPSIDASACGCWHGFITNGEIT
jgi:hypothetical protein